MPSISAISTDPISGLVWENPDESLFGANAETVFGESPLDFITVVEDDDNRFYNLLTRMRDETLPRLWASANTQETIIVHQSWTDGSADNPLLRERSVVNEAANAIITGPTTDDIRSQMLNVEDLSAVFIASDLTYELDEQDLVQVDGVNYTIVSVKPIPRVSRPVAYRVGLKKG